MTRPPLEEWAERAEAYMAKAKSIEWGTPDSVFLPLKEEFGLDLDVCATPGREKLPHYFSPAEDGLMQNWAPFNCWMNPPYGRGIVPWVKKAATCHARYVVALLPVRSDTAWWHDYVLGEHAEVRFMRGRVKFIGPDGKPGDAAPFPTAIVIWRKPLF